VAASPLPELERVRELVHTAAGALEASRQRIDDLNVYPVPDGDTGTNMTLTMRAVVDALDASQVPDRAALAHEATRAALMGARGNSGVILSQVIRGFAERLGGAEAIDASTLANAFRSAGDAAYAGVREPVEGTMLTVARELADEAERQAAAGAEPVELLTAVLARGEQALARTTELLDVLRTAGVVDAGGAGLVELVRGLAAGVAGEPLPEPPPREELGYEAIHQELSLYRYCTTFVIEGRELDAKLLEAEFDRLGNSVLVVGDPAALKVHLHTDDPGAALSVGAREGVLERIEIANMHRQTVQREARLLDAVDEEGIADVVAIVAGEGNRRLFESLGAAQIVEGGQSMNPAAGDILAAIERSAAPEAIVLPNNPNVLPSAEQAAGLAAKPVHVIPTRSLAAGLAVMVAFDATRPAEENAAAMREALRDVVTGAVTRATRDAEVNGLRIAAGQYLGLLDEEPIAATEDLESAATAVVERLLAEPRDVLTLLTGEDEPPLDELVAELERRHPGVELEVHSGGQPHYPLLISAE
jgi:DAK2 domain fusion protein YloV